MRTHHIPSRVTIPCFSVIENRDWRDLIGLRNTARCSFALSRDENFSGGHGSENGCVSGLRVDVIVSSALREEALPRAVNQMATNAAKSTATDDAPSTLRSRRVVHAPIDVGGRLETSRLKDTVATLACYPRKTTTYPATTYSNLEAKNARKQNSLSLPVA